MGVLRTFILLISVVLEAGGLLAVMVAGGGLLQIDAVSTSIKPYSSVLPPSLLSGHLGGMVPTAARSKEGGDMDGDSFSNTGDLDLLRTDHSSQRCLRRPHAIAGGHECHSDGDGDFPQVVAAAIQSGPSGWLPRLSPPPAAQQGSVIDPPSRQCADPPAPFDGHEAWIINCINLECPPLQDPARRRFADPPAFSVVRAERKASGVSCRSSPQPSVLVTVPWGPPSEWWVLLLQRAMHARAILGRRVRWSFGGRGFVEATNVQSNTCYTPSEWTSWCPYLLLCLMFVSTF